MNQLITIPQPCHEDWNQMTQQEQGRHCNACCKTVIDFTGWEPQEILFYLNINAGNKICGRFTTEQLERPLPGAEEFVKEITLIPLSWIKRAAAIFIFAFMIGASSCNDKADRTTGVIAMEGIKIDSARIKDTVQHSANITGTVALPAPAKCTKIVTVKGEIMGDIVMQSPPPPPEQPGPPVLMGEPAVQPVPVTPDTNVVMGKVAMPQK